MQLLLSSDVLHMGSFRWRVCTAHFETQSSKLSMSMLEPGAVTYLLRSVHPKSVVQALEEQLQAMQRQLAEVKQLQQSNTSLGHGTAGHRGPYTTPWCVGGSHTGSQAFRAKLKCIGVSRAITIFVRNCSCLGGMFCLNQGMPLL